jgi:hypothetical protein
MPKKPKPEIYICPVCGGPKRRASVMCQECFVKAHRVTLVCTTCKKVFTRGLGHYTQAIRRNPDIKFYCSRKCMPSPRLIGMNKGKSDNPQRHYKDWTDADDAYIIEHLNDSANDVAFALGRTGYAVRRRKAWLKENGLIEYQEGK